MGGGGSNHAVYYIGYKIYPYICMNKMLYSNTTVYDKSYRIHNNTMLDSIDNLWDNLFYDHMYTDTFYYSILEIRNNYPHYSHNYNHKMYDL